MKTLFLKTFAFVVIMALSIVSCKKDDTTSPSVSNDEAADAVGNMVSSDFTVSTSSSAAVSSNDAAKANGRIAVGGRTESTSCGVLKDSTFIRNSLSGALISFADTLDYNYTMACTGIIPTSLTLTLAANSSRTGIKISSSGSSAAAFTLSGFPASVSSYSINGTFDRTETVKEIGTTKSYTATHQLTVTNVLVDKNTYTLKGGTATYTMTGTYGTTTYTHTGTVTFLGNGSATITVNGNNYTVDLATGTVTKA